MALNFTIKRETINFNGGSIDLRGLSVPDVITLVGAHRNTATEAFKKVSGLDGKTSSVDALYEAVTVFPELVAHIIALAADAVEQFDQVTKLPVDVQVTALEKIAELTFAIEGGAKNFAQTVMRIAKNANGLVSDLNNSPSTIGYGDSAVNSAN